MAENFRSIPFIELTDNQTGEKRTIDAGRVKQITLSKGGFVTVYWSMESFAVNSIHATDFEMLSLIQMQDKVQKYLLKKLTKKFLDHLDDDSSGVQE